MRPEAARAAAGAGFRPNVTGELSPCRIFERGDSNLIVPRLYEDLTVLHQNTMPDRAYFVPSSTRNDRLAWRSDRMQMLSGCEWRFAYYPSIH